MNAPITTERRLSYVRLRAELSSNGEGVDHGLDKAAQLVGNLSEEEASRLVVAILKLLANEQVAIKKPVPAAPAADTAIPKPILDALALCRTKSQDYNAVVGRDAYFPLGLPSYAHEIYKKGLRLINLSSTKSQPNHESVRDTALDLINYATFLAEAVDKGTVLP